MSGGYLGCHNDSSDNGRYSNYSDHNIMVVVVMNGDDDYDDDGNDGHGNDNDGSDGNDDDNVNDNDGDDNGDDSGGFDKLKKQW